ncbi:MAG: hypothetical protein JNJ97_06485, partial [Alphaproteobacteria bacterium]|nr:hypothetical protein [Alphaproteobacteria bacterium]
MTEYSIAFAPLIPAWALALLALIAVPVIGYALFAKARGAGWRLAALAGLLLALANPLAVIEQRQSLPDVALVVVDESASMRIGERAERAERAANALRDRLGRERDMEVRVVRAGAGGVGTDGTRLFDSIERAVADV